jgi:hypothetical protein
VPLFESIRRQMIFTKQEPDRWENHDVLKLTAVWNAEITKGQTASGQWPPLEQREYRLFLDAKTFWLYRLEWWGPIGQRGPDSLMMTMEFRDPLIIKPGDKPPEAFSAAFNFDPGKDKVTDGTKLFVEGAAQISARQQAAPMAPPTGRRP